MEGSGNLVSVVVPVYNEADNILPCLRGLWQALKDTPHELLICYDHEQDTTLPAIAAMPDRPPSVRLVRNDLGPGVLRAIQAGFAAAAGDVVVTFMADLSDPPEVILAMAAKVRAGAAVVSGSRYMKGGRQVGGPLLKRTMSRLAGLSLHWLAGVGTHDATTNFRAYSRRFLRQVTVESTGGFELALELTVKAHLAGLKVDETPSTWTDRTAGASRFRLRKWLPCYLRWYWKAMAKRLALVLLFVLALSLLSLHLAAWAPQQFGTSLDPSWQAILHPSFEQARHFGSELIFTYGPYGFLDTNVYYPATFPWMLLLQLLLCAAMALALVRIVHVGVANGWKAALWIAALGLLTTPGCHGLAFCLLALVLLDRERPVQPATVLLAAALGLASLIKFTYFMMGAWVLVLLSAEDILRRRRWPWLLTVFVASLLAFWMAARQPLSGLGGFLLSSLQMSAGYTGAMSHSPPGENIWAFASAAALLLAAVAVWKWRQHRWAAALPLAAVGGLFLLMFKQVFVRHVVDAVLVGPWFVLLLLPVLWRAAPRWWTRPLALAALAASLLPTTSLAGFSFAQQCKKQLTRMEESLAGAAKLVRRDHDLRRQFLARCQEVRQEVAFPPIQGTVDIYPYGQGYVLANDWRYCPRPVLQSYSAYTPALAEKNLRHLRQPEAPDTIFFGVQSVDSRWPSQDDGLSWPEILTRYDLRGAAGPYLWFQKSPRPRTWRLVPLAELQSRLGQDVSLAGYDGPLWARIDLKPTAWGKAASLLYKTPLPTIAVGGHPPMQLVPALARAGFLLSPLVQSANDFRCLLTEPQAGVRPAAIRLAADRSLYEADCTIRLFRLEFPAQGDSLAEQFQAAGPPCLRIGPGSDPGAFRGLHEAAITPAADGLRVRAITGDPYFELPPIDPPKDQSLLVRLEITSPATTTTEVFYTTASQPGFAPQRMVGATLQPGRNTVYLPIAGPGLAGRMRLDVGAVPGDYLVHSLEIRPIAP